MKTEPRPIAVYYEHPEWFRPLFEELDRRGLPYVRLDASRQRFDPSGAADDFASDTAESNDAQDLAAQLG